MFGCIITITGSLCSIVSVLSCVAVCYVVADCELWYEIKELLLLLENRKRAIFINILGAPNAKAMCRIRKS